jgi:O-antigen/teichoic acid export membrane protein
MDGLTEPGPAPLMPAPPGPSSGAPTAGDQGFNVRSFARGGLFSLFGALTSGVLGFVFAVVVTRKFPEETVGVLFTVLSVFLLAYTFVRLGASTGAVYFVARLSALGQPERVRSVLRSALPPVVWVSLTTALGLILLAPWLGRVILSSAPDEAAQALRVLACFLPFAAVMDVCLYGTRGLHRLRPLVLVDQIGRPIAQLLLVVGCVIIGTKSASGLVFAWASPYLPAAVIAATWLWVLLRKSERAKSVVIPKPGTMHREFWGYSWARWFQSIAQIGLQRVDIILVAAISGAKEAAIYAAVTRFLVFGQLAAGSITAVAQPRISKLVALKDTAGVEGLYRVSTTWLVLGTWPLYLGLVVFSAQLPMIFGESYSSGTPVVVILGLTMLVATGCGLVDVVLSMAGRTTWTFANAVSALAVNVSVDLVLIPRIGILGAAIGWSVAILVKNLVPLFLVERHLHINPFGRGTLTAGALALGCLGIVPGTFALVGASFLVLLVTSALAFALYAFLVWRRRSLFHLDVLRRGTGGAGDRVLRV